MSTRSIASGGMSRISPKLEIRWPFNSRTGASPPRPRPLWVWGEMTFKSSCRLPAPVARMSRRLSWFSGGVVAGVELVRGRDVADHGATLAAAGDDDRLVAAFVAIVLRAGPAGGRGG